MRWFRRSLDEFEGLDWVVDEGFMSPSFPRVRPEPWRYTDYAFVVPVSFIEVFADLNYINDIERLENDYVASLVESIDCDGLREPPTMFFDASGKIRYSDGYHRLTAIRKIDGFDWIPVRLEWSPYVKGWGRPVSEEVLHLFEVFNGLSPG